MQAPEGGFQRRDSPGVGRILDHIIETATGPLDECYVAVDFVAVDERLAGISLRTGFTGVQCSIVVIDEYERCFDGITVFERRCEVGFLHSIFSREARRRGPERAEVCIGFLVAAYDGGGSVDVCVAGGATLDSPSRVDAAAVTTHGAPAGEPMVPRFGPSLPAATIVSTPAFVAAINATSSGAVVRRSELPTE